MKQELKIVGEDASRVAKRALTYLSYPILGNLSRNLRKDLESTLDGFSEKYSAGVSVFTNTIAYTSIMGYLGSTLTWERPREQLMLTFMFGFIPGFFEGSARHFLWTGGRNNDEASGSVIGEAVSLPLEYFKSVRDRARRK